MNPVLRELSARRTRRLPVVLAGEAAECGLACIAMIACWHGHDIDLNSLRQRYALSLNGVSLRGLMDIAEGLGLASRPVRAQLEGLRYVRAPAILHWDQDHFVVLKACDRRGATIHDPTEGARRLSWDEVARRFSGIVLELSPSEGFQPITARARTRIRSLWSRVDGFWTCAAQVLGLSLALQVLAFASPFYLQLVVDQAIDRGDADLLSLLAVAFGLAAVLWALVEACRSWTLQVAGQLANFQIIGNLVRQLFRLRADFFEKRHIGDIVSRLNSAKHLQEVITRGIAAALIDGLMALVAAALLIVYSPRLALLVFGFVALQVIIMVLTFTPLRRWSALQLTEAAAEQSLLMESVRAATTIRLFGAEAAREGRWRNAYARVINANLALGRWQVSAQLAQNLATGVQAVLIVFLGARAVMNSSGFSLGMLLAFLALRQTFSDRVVNFLTQAQQFRLLGLHLERLGDIVHADPEVAADASPSLPSRAAARLVLENVSFRYGSTDRFILRNVSLAVEPGEFLAITGRSGGGKTTLLKLMLGLHAPTEGRMLLGDLPANPMQFRAWREHVGVVAQDDQLLSGSIASNIAFFDPDLDMARVLEAAKMAMVHDEIMRMPMQYLSLVGDMGSTLSGGQRQRVLLARALYRRPAVLFLDEGTANLDVATELHIAQTLSDLPITRIVVAHRPALLDRAHRVLHVSNEGVEDLGRAARPAGAASGRG
jgi:ATP-binding cassette subfamily B protein RaxB